MPSRLWLILLTLASSSACFAAPEQPDPRRSPQRPPAAALPADRQIFAAFADGDYQRAAALIEQRLALAPNDAMTLYNGACAYSRLGQRDRAADYLLRAIEAGFADFTHMQRDPDLAAIRDHPKFTAVLEALGRVRARHGLSAYETWRATYGDEKYRYEADPIRRLAYATALDEESHTSMRAMLEAEADHLLATLFDGPPEYEVLIAIPTPDDARLLLSEARTGHNANSVGGIYEHARRRLIARNIGGSLRHEFLHVMHYGDMERRRQLHRLWVQEGLASLFEDYRVEADGSITFLPNERHNVAKGLAAAGKLVDWAEFFDLPDARFMAAAERSYPQARSIFHFIAERGLLGAWYRAYVDGFAVDSSGRVAFERAFDASIKEIERQWRRWLQQQPLVDLRIEPGDAALGVQIDVREGIDGVRIERVIAGSAAARAGLRPGDVILSIDGEPTPTGRELRAIVAARRVGDRVEVRVRRLTTGDSPRRDEVVMSVTLTLGAAFNR